jgi:hypothetical protein
MVFTKSSMPEKWKKYALQIGKRVLPIRKNNRIAGGLMRSPSAINRMGIVVVITRKSLFLALLEQDQERFTG